MNIRHSAVAGTFYPSDPDELRRQLQFLLIRNNRDGIIPKVMIVPHASYLYSGPVAASAYSRLSKVSHKIKRVILIGPSHRIEVRGLAVPTVEAFETPLGLVHVDVAAVKNTLCLEQVCHTDSPHVLEHSLEVHLPFLQYMLDAFEVVPFLVGSAEPLEVAEVLDKVWGGDETIIIVSSDLSHQHSYVEAGRLDSHTSEEICSMQCQLTGEQASGCVAINGLMILANQYGMQVEKIDVRNSGDTAGSKENVVGYGAYALHSDNIPFS